MTSASSCADLVPSQDSGLQVEHAGSVIPIRHSPNWSGYQVSGATYTAVTAHWTIPTGTGPSPTAFAYSSGWVGVGTGNDTNHPLIQAGSDSYGNGGSGRTNHLWWEVYPRNHSQTVYNSTILDGDSLTVTVTASSTRATFHFVDTSSNLNLTYSYSASLGSPQTAEWIHERPRINGSLPYLAKANYSFSAGQAQCVGCGSWLTISGLSPTAYVMYNCKQTAELAQPGPLSSDGKGFTSTWKGYGGGANDVGC